MLSGPEHSFYRWSKEDKPVQEGQTYQLRIIAKGSKGDGVAKIKGYVIFVPGASVGDEVQVEIIKVRRTAAQGEVVS